MTRYFRVSAYISFAAAIIFFVLGTILARVTTLLPFVARPALFGSAFFFTGLGNGLAFLIFDRMKTAGFRRPRTTNVRLFVSG